MNVSKISGVKIEAVYACYPGNEIDNLVELQKLYGDEAKNIVKATGINKRFYAAPGTSSLDLCCDCAREIIEDGCVERADIGGIVFVTFTPEHMMPANAMAVQSRLGLDNNIPAFDLGLACSGYGFGLWIASMMAKNTQKKILLLDGDVQSAYLSGLDKSTLPVLSDAGSATIVAPDDNSNEWFFSFYTDGSKRDVLSIKAGGSKYPVTHEDLEYTTYDDGSQRRNVDIYMDGFEIYKFVAQEVSAFLPEFMQETGFSAEKIDSFVPHQANMFMIKQLTRKLGISKDDMWKSGDEYGNSASATVPLTIACNAKTMLKKEVDNRILFSGFGGGLSISAGLITLDRNINYKIYKYQK